NLFMRIGILANSLPAALRIYDEAQAVPGVEVFVLLAPLGSDGGLFKHVARFVAKSGREKSMKLVGKGAVVRFRKPLQDPETVSRLQQLKLDVGLHKSGNIYSRDTIECFRLGILNAHIGLLPKYRGRSVMEWSLVQGDPTGISVFFVDAGIDTGERIVLSETLDVWHCQSIAEAKQYLFECDARVYRRAIEKLQQDETPFQNNDGSGKRYYVMSKLFQDVAQKNLTIGNRQAQI
ncbi:MAG TPA: formyltransferase family protein, partial [Pyrinomonadaceae bacterium]|nr:formyltransferase family protein [Pyrinomonadaceae bacterium]